MTWLWWALLVAALLHITEEFAWPGGFADWDRAYRPQIRQSITPRLHIVVNAMLIALCITVALAGSGTGSEAGSVTVGRLHFRSMISPDNAGIAWIALAALLFSNAVFHLVGALRTGRYSPGMVTGILLYMPLAVYGCWQMVSSGRASPGAALIAAALGGSYHLWAGMLHSLRARSAATAPSRPPSTRT